MPDLSMIGRWVMIAGGLVILVGGALWLAGRVLGGRAMPGTLRIDMAGMTCVIPILLSLILSVVLTVGLNLLLRLLNK